MSWIELLFISVGLAMDAFAVSICKGLAIPRIDLKKATVIAAFFAFFQGFMPYLGYHLGLAFSDKIMAIDHWVMFILLCLVGGNMILESRNQVSDEDYESLHLGDLLMSSIATSIDALAIGIGFAFFGIEIIPSITLIAIVTFIICFIGVNIGTIVGNKFSNKAEFFGGLVLILIGIKVLLEHLLVW